MADVLLTLAIAGVSATALGWLAHRLRLPSALGYLAAGLAFSPGIPWTPTFDTQFLHQAADVGSLFLLFILGLELDLKKLRSILSQGAVSAAVGMLVTGLAAAALARLAGWGILQSIALGMCLSLSSTLLGERLTASARLASVRNRVLGILVVEDILAVGLLALIVVMGGTGGPWYLPALKLGQVLLLFILFAAGALLVVPRFLDAVARSHAHDLVVLAAGACILAAGAVGALSGSMHLGALLAGVAAAEAGSRFVVRNAVQGLRDASLGLFFFVAGAVVPLEVLGDQLPLAAAAAGTLVLGRIVVNVPASLAAGLSPEAALRSAVALIPLGEFSLILVAAASAQGLAHPGLSATVVGATLILIFAVPLLMAGVPWALRAAGHLPEPARKRLRSLQRSLQRDARDQGSAEVARAVRLLVANLVVFLGWIVAAAAIGPYLLERVPSPVAAPVLVFGIGLAVAAPLGFACYRRYRDLVHLIVRGEGGALRARLVDVWVTASAVLLFLPVAVLVPRALPVLLGSLALAIVVAALAWRQLGSFHQALASSVTRVLGHDPESAPLLDRVLAQYPWGVRVAAVAVPSASPVANRSLADARIPELSGATVAVVQRHRREIVNPPSTETLRPGDTLVLLGDEHQLARAEALVVAHGEALRLNAQSRLARLEELTVQPGSDLVGRPLKESDVAGRTGSSVVGLWVQGGQHPLPHRDDLVPAAGDRLIVLGSPLQVQRARLLAEGVGGVEGP